MHALSDRDSTSSFSGIGKEKFFRIVCKDERYYNAVSILGESDTINDKVVEILEELFCNVYGATDEIDIISACYAVFKSETGMKLFYLILSYYNQYEVMLAEKWHLDRFPKTLVCKDSGQ